MRDNYNWTVIDIAMQHIPFCLVALDVLRGS